MMYNNFLVVINFLHDEWKGGKKIYKFLRIMIIGLYGNCIKIMVEIITSHTDKETVRSKKKNIANKW